MSFQKTILIIVLFIFILTCFYLVYAAGSKNWPFKVKYQAVALESGEIYFGNLSLFPNPKIMNVWTLQQTQGENEASNLQLVPFKSSYFTPENTMYLNMEKIIWWTNLDGESQVVKIMKGEVQADSGEKTTQPETEPTTKTTPKTTE